MPYRPMWAVFITLFYHWNVFVVITIILVRIHLGVYCLDKLHWGRYLFFFANLLSRTLAFNFLVEGTECQVELAFWDVRTYVNRKFKQFSMRCRSALRRFVGTLLLHLKTFSLNFYFLQHLSFLSIPLRRRRRFISLSKGSLVATGKRD